jgi:hypothetical protein
VPAGGVAQHLRGERELAGRAGRGGAQGVDRRIGGIEEGGVGQGAKGSSGPRAYNGRAQLAGSSEGPEVPRAHQTQAPVSAPAPCKAHLL